MPSPRPFISSRLPPENKIAIWELVASLQQAHSEAVKPNKTCTISFNQAISGTTYDYVAWFDGDHDDTRDPGVSFETALGGGVGLGTRYEGGGAPPMGWRSIRTSSNRISTAPAPETTSPTSIADVRMLRITLEGTTPGTGTKSDSATPPPTAPTRRRQPSRSETWGRIGIS